MPATAATADGRGLYGLYTVSWSVAHIIGHTLGLNLVAWFDFDPTWILFTGLLLVAVGMLYVVERMVKQEKARTAN